MRLLAPLLVLSLVILLGCVPVYGVMVRPSVEAAPSQDVVYKNGMVIATSKAPHSEVLLEPVAGATGRYRASERVGYIVSIKNLSSSRIEVSESSVTASANGAAVHVFLASEIEDEIHGSAAWAQAFNFIGGVLEASGTRSVAARSVVANQTAANASAISGGERSQVGALATWALQRTTLEPGESVVGGVSAYAPRTQVCTRTVKYPESDVSHRVGGACQWTVSIKVGGDIHVFKIGEAIEELR